MRSLYSDIKTTIQAAIPSANTAAVSRIAAFNMIASSLEIFKDRVIFMHRQICNIEHGRNEILFLLVSIDCQ